MDDVSSPPAPAETPTVPQETDEEIQPIPVQPPEQEYQTANPEQLLQTRTDDDPPVHGVSKEEAEEGRKSNLEKEGVTGSTSLLDLAKKAYFIADGLDEPEVKAVSPRQIQINYPEDDSLIIIRMEVRPGRWGGVSSIALDDAGKKHAQKHYEEQKKIFEEKKKLAKEFADYEAQSDAHAREGAKPLDPPKSVPQPEEPRAWQEPRDLEMSREVAESREEEVNRA